MLYLYRVRQFSLSFKAVEFALYFSLVVGQKRLQSGFTKDLVAAQTPKFNRTKRMAKVILGDDPALVPIAESDLPTKQP